MPISRLDDDDRVAARARSGPLRPDALPPESSTLPVPLTSLVGRDADVIAVCALLDDGAVRLLTLTGPGGVGKTRLAVAVARAAERQYAHGAVFVRLAAIRDPALVPVAIAGALGLLDTSGRPPAQAVIDHLREQHLLLVLDNIEHLLPAAVWIAELLAACPCLTVLPTSRVPLRVMGEQRYPVSPLPVPAEGQCIDLTQMPQYAALELFARRACAVLPGFSIDAGNIGAITAICQRLDGLPLAIELAAARLSIFAPETLADRLSRSLPLLTGGPRDAPERLQSLRGAIDWSYALLPADERAFLQWLSVFIGGFALDEAEAIGVALGHDADWTLGAVTSLVEQSLLRLYLEMGDAWSAVRVQRVLGQFAMNLGDHAKAWHLLTESRWQARALGDPWTEVRASHLLAELAYRQATSGHDLADALTLAEESLRLTRAYREQHNLPAVLLTAGNLRWRTGDVTGAALLFDEAVATARRTGDRKMSISSLGSRAALARHQGELAVAIESLTIALHTATMEHLPTDEAFLLRELAALAYGVQQPERAARLFGAADKVQRQGEPAKSVFDRADNATDLKDVRDALDAPTFAHAWDTGQVMTEGGIVAEVMALRAAIPAMAAPALAVHLSARELEILKRMAAGGSNQQIARELFLSYRTVTSHVTTILGKLGVTSRTGAVAFAIRSGLA